MKALARTLSGLAAGALFGAGLSWSRMTDPRKVLSFLDVTGNWDSSLLLVIGSAVVLTHVGYRIVLRRPAPLFDDRFHLPLRTRIDASLLLGAAIFGIGWGLAGYCPGPAIASLGFGNPEMLWFLPAVLVGITLQRTVSRHRARDGAS